MKLADGLFTSKIRYELQLLGKVRLSDSDPSNTDFDNIQKDQNKRLRMFTNTKLLDMVSTVSLLKQRNMMSVNQINGQIKIQEIWKAINVDSYPIEIKKTNNKRHRSGHKSLHKWQTDENLNKLLFAPHVSLHKTLLVYS